MESADQIFTLRGIDAGFPAQAESAIAKSVVGATTQLIPSNKLQQQNLPYPPPLLRLKPPLYWIAPEMTQAGAPYFFNASYIFIRLTRRQYNRKSCISTSP
jgi:hypothetical protein